MRRTVSVLAVVLAAAVSSVGLDQCPSYDTLGKTVYLPHPYDCSLFRRCQAGQPILGHCPPGKHFNPGTSTCGNPAQSGCTAVSNACSSKTPLSTCRYKCSCTKAEEIDTCPAKLQFGAELSIVNMNLHPGCDKEPTDFTLRNGKLGALTVRNATSIVSMCDDATTTQDVPHFADCTRAIHCENGGEVGYQCPQGYSFEPLLRNCGRSQYLGCTRSLQATRAGCSVGDALSKCQQTCRCEVLNGNCPARLGFKTTFSVFDAVKQPACLKGPMVVELDDQFAANLVIQPKSTQASNCPRSQQMAPSYLPDPENCGAFFLCFHGREMAKSCSKGLHFNSRTKKCTNPDPAVCTPAPPPTMPPPPPLVAFDNVTCPAAAKCPARSDINKVAHLTDCTLFCRCVSGTASLDACPPGLHFSSQTRTCEDPAKAGCKTYCSSLAPSAGGTWNPSTCAAGDSNEDTECKLQCDSSHQLIGSAVVKCTNKGWDGSGGLNIIPSCNTLPQLGDEMINKINETMKQLNLTHEDAGMLFILDESGSVKAPNFQIEKDFVAAIVNAFPLSQKRQAGLITFSDNAVVDINLSQTSTCDFLSKLQRVAYYRGGTDLGNALRVALAEINRYFTNKTVLVFVVTDGLSQTDPVADAKVLRDDDNILFTIGVAGYNRKQLEPISSTYKDGSMLFYGIPNFEGFKVVADYLNTTYASGVASNCP